MTGRAALVIVASLALSGCHLVFGVDGSTAADDVVDPDGAVAPDVFAGDCAPTLVTDGLVAWYPMKGLDGASLPACVGTAGTCPTGACPDEDPNGVYGSALKFGIGRYISVVDTPLPSGRTQQMTAAFWMRVDLAPVAVCPVRKLHGTDVEAWSLCVRSSSDLTVIATAQWTDASNNTTSDVAIEASGIVTGAWTHVAMRSDGTQVELFIGGVSASLKPISGLVDDANVLQLGSDPIGTPDTSFDGALADLRIYDRALNDLEIKQLTLRSQP